jgi:hypothetical protein
MVQLQEVRHLIDCRGTRLDEGAVSRTESTTGAKAPDSARTPHITEKAARSDPLAKELLPLAFHVVVAL